MLVYHQSSGELFLHGVLLGVGYSGKGEGLNNPETEWKPNVGPIPSGKYNIGAPFYHSKKGPVCMRLEPVDHDARGRSGFMIHGDNKHLNHTASEGCIILSRNIRQIIADDLEFELEVL